MLLTGQKFPTALPTDAHCQVQLFVTPDRELSDAQQQDLTDRFVTFWETVRSRSETSRERLE
jgi:hypothetical protein